MQLKIFSSFIKDVINEGNRLQKVDINGNVSTKKRFTQTQILSLVASIAILFFLKRGFTDNFAGYVISFLSIFIGLFASIVISLFDKSHNLKEKLLFEKSKQQNNTSNTDEIARLRKIRNYLVQFTGLTSYAIYLAICLIVLLIFILLHDFLKDNIFNYTFVEKFGKINKQTIWLFLKTSILIFHRALVSYLLINFFTITLYAVTSYFSYISSEYKKQVEQ